MTYGWIAGTGEMYEITPEESELAAVDAYYA
jgi:hypothetical protein